MPPATQNTHRVIRCGASLSVVVVWLDVPWLATPSFPTRYVFTDITKFATRTDYNYLAIPVNRKPPHVPAFQHVQVHTNRSEAPSYGACRHKMPCNGVGTSAVGAGAVRDTGMAIA